MVIQYVDLTLSNNDNDFANEHVVRFPNQLAFGSWLGERTPKKQGFQL